MPNAKIDMTKPIRRKCDHHRIGGASPAVIVHGDPEAGSFHMTPEEFAEDYENVPEPPPRRVRIGSLEFYCHLRDFQGAPLVYVSTAPSMRPPMKVGKIYGHDLRKLRDWASAMLGEGT